jgi:macrolide transport system ATP-binding/permease protein
MKVFRRKNFEAEMDAELRGHIEAYTADLVRFGLIPAEAERRARVEFGPVEAAKDRCRESWGLRHLDDLRSDLRLTWRALRRNRGFAAVAILSLALGIGANTAIFGLVDAVMLRLLPVRDPASLVFIENAGTKGANSGPPYPCFELLRDQTLSFEGMAAFSPSDYEMLAGRGREQVRGLWVSGNFYALLGVKPLRGRALHGDDDKNIGEGGSDGPVAVITLCGFWLTQLGLLGKPGCSHFRVSA